MTSHLITDSFVSGVAFFPLLVSSLSPLIPFPFRFSKKSGKVVLPSSCGFFCACFLWPEKIVSGRGRPLRSGGGGGGGSGGGETWVHAAAAAVERAGSYTTVRGLRQIGQNLRPDGTSAGSCGKKPDKKRAEGVKAREKDERHWQTRERERAREQLGSDGGGAGVQWVEAATGVREQEQAQPPATSRARALTGGHTQEAGEVEGRAGKEEGARAVPLYAAFTYFRKWHVLSNEWNE